MHHGGVGKDGQMLPFAAHNGFADGYGVITDGNFSFNAAIKELVLEEEHGVIVADRGLQQPLGIIRSRGIDHLQPGRVHEIHLRIRGVERASVHAAAGRPTNHHRGRGIPEVMSLGDKIRDLIERANDEVDELHFANGTQAAVAHPASSADDGALADRRINHALPAEALEQTFAGLEGAAVNADIFAHQNDRRVALHLLEHGLLDGFEKRDLRCVRGAAIRTGAVRLGHGYLRAFLEALAAAALTVFFGATLAAIFAAGFPPFADFALFPGACTMGGVSPK